MTNEDTHDSKTLTTKHTAYTRKKNKLFYKLENARNSENPEDMLKYSLYLPIPLFLELERDAEHKNMTVSRHVVYILQLAYGHINYESPQYVSRIEGVFDDDSKPDFEFPKT